MGIILRFLDVNVKKPKIAYKRLDCKDRKKVKENPCFLENLDFIGTRILKNQARKKAVCLAHKKGFCVLASGKKGLGVDIEELKERDFSGIVDFCFNANEKEMLEMSPNKLLTFYQIFTTKEALLKSQNLGFEDFKKVSFFAKNFIKLHFIKKKFFITLVWRKEKYGRS